MEPREQVVLEPRNALVLGGDLGGTSSRIVIADTAGTVLGRGAAGGGNPTAHPASAAAAVGEALTAALAGLDGGRVAVAVLGAAGGPAWLEPPIKAELDAVWGGAGLTCPPQFWSDVEVAYAAGTAEPDGSALIAGTGATGGAIEGHRLVRSIDGHGWLLGDEGSGFWIGREGLRHLLRTLDAGAPVDRLGADITERLLGPDAPPPGIGPRRGLDQLRDALISEVYRRKPVLLAELAPAVIASYDAGDEPGRAIVTRAAELLADTVGRVRTPEQTTPLVLGGSVVGGSVPGEWAPVGRQLRELLADRFAGTVYTARDGAGGAAWLALGELDPAVATLAAHSRLTTVRAPGGTPG